MQDLFLENLLASGEDGPALASSNVATSIMPAGRRPTCT